MRTTHSSSRLGGGGLHQAPPPGPDPLGPGTPSSTRAPQNQAPPRDQAPRLVPDPLGPDIPPVDRMTDRCKHITLPQTLFAGGNYKSLNSN